MKVKKLILSAVLMIAAMGCFTGCLININPDMLPSYDSEDNKKTFKSYLGNKEWWNETKHIYDKYSYFDTYKINSDNTISHSVKFYNKYDYNLNNPLFSVTVNYTYIIPIANSNEFSVELNKESISIEKSIPTNIYEKPDMQTFLRTDSSKSFYFSKYPEKIKVANSYYH